MSDFTVLAPRESSPANGELRTDSLDSLLGQIADQNAAWQAQQAREAAEGWSTPTPYHVESVDPPLHLLPPVIRNVVNSVSTHLQNAPTLSVLSALVTVASATVGRVEIVGDWDERLMIWAFPVADSSERKSGTVKLISTQPLNAAMKLVREGMASEVQAAIGRRKFAEKRVKALESQIGKADSTVTEDELTRAYADLAAAKVPVQPHFMLTEGTAEGTEKVMMNNCGTAAVIAAEGEMMDNLAGKYGGNGGNVGNLNSAYSGGEPILAARAGDSRYIDNPSLNMLMMVQPLLLGDLNASYVFTEKGFCARWLYGVPASRVDTADSVTPPLDRRALGAWELVIQRLLSRFWVSDPNDQSVVRLTIDDRGIKRIQELRERIKFLSNRPDTSRAEGHWLGKAAGHVMRIAGAFALASDPNATTISGRFVDDACRLFEWLHWEARIAFGQSADGFDVEHADAILKWIVRRNVTVFSARDLKREGPNGYRKVDAGEVLAGLRNHGYLREMPEANRGNGAWLVNPEWLARARIKGIAAR